MSQSLTKNLLHLVFSTKNRHPWLNAAIQPKLYAYLAGIHQQCDSPALAIGGFEDHVHVLFVLHKNQALSKVVEHVKKGSSKWIKTQSRMLADFGWQRGYSAFSVSESNVAIVRRYIERQAEHHRRMSFQEELRQLLKRHKIEFDEAYLWS